MFSYKPPSVSFFGFIPAMKALIALLKDIDYLLFINITVFWLLLFYQRPKFLTEERGKFLKCDSLFKCYVWCCVVLQKKRGKLVNKQLHVLCICSVQLTVALTGGGPHSVFPHLPKKAKKPFTGG